MVYRLSSFDEVAKAYNDIKPIRGSRANQDLRPLAQRRYWWNRVMKVNENKYLLLYCNWGWHSNVTPEFRELSAPIVWERKESGDYITIRNHMNDGISVSRYTFLAHHLPKDLFFHYENGKHFVRHHVNGVDHYLPKFKAKVDWQNGTIEMYEDNKIIFKHDKELGFVRENGLQPYKTRRIDKQADAWLKPKLAELVEWMQIVLPILGGTLVAERSEYARKLTHDRAYSFYSWQKYVRGSEIREILDNPEHENRMALAVCLANEVDAVDKEHRFEMKHDSLALMRKIVRKIADVYAVELR